MPVAARTPAGTAVPIRVDREGDRTRAPPDHASIAKSGMARGALLLFGVPVLIGILYALLSAVLDAHRQRRWARDWAAIEPKWNSRLP